MNSPSSCTSNPLGQAKALAPFELIEAYQDFKSIKGALTILKGNFPGKITQLAIETLKKTDFLSLPYTDQWALAKFRDETKDNPKYPFISPLEIPSSDLLVPVSSDESREKQKIFMISVANRIVSDYLLTEKTFMNEFLKEHLKSSLKTEFEKGIEAFCFPEKGNLEAHHKRYFLKALQGISLFVQHLGETLTKLREAETPLHEAPIEKVEELLMAGLNTCRERIHRKKIFEPKNTPEGAEAAMSLHLSGFIAHLIEGMKINIPESSKKSMPALIKTLGNLMAIGLSFTLSNERIYLLADRLISHPFTFEKQSDLKFESKQVLDPEFSQEMGKLFAKIGKDALQIAPAKRVAKVALKGIVKVSEHVNLFGDFVQKELIELLESPTRINLFRALSELLWIKDQKNHLPYLLDPSHLEKVLKNKGIIEEQFFKMANAKIQGILKPEEKKSGFFKKIGGKIASKAVEKEGSLEDYTHHVSKILFRLALSPKVIFMLLSYIMESVDD